MSHFVNLFTKKGPLLQITGSVEGEKNAKINVNNGLRSICFDNGSVIEKTKKRSKL